VTWPDGHFAHHQFDRELDGHWKKRNSNRLPFGTSFQLIPTRSHERESADFAMSDETLRAYLLWRFPKLGTSPRKRKYAARLARMIYLWFRCGLSSEEIGAEMDMKAVCVQVRMRSERRRAEKFFDGEFSPAAGD
jgi:hypothetical protein